MHNIVQVMGPGCGRSELEGCPVEYHFELTQEELIQAALDPQVIERELGLPYKIAGIYVGAREQAVTEGADAGQPMYCCRPCLTNSICCIPWPQ